MADKPEIVPPPKAPVATDPLAQSATGPSPLRPAALWAQVEKEINRSRWDSVLKAAVPEPNDTTQRVPPMTFRERLWQLAHNNLAHPVEGLAVLVLGYCPQWVSTFHDWTAKKAFLEGDDFSDFGEGDQSKPPKPAEPKPGPPYRTGFQVMPILLSALGMEGFPAQRLVIDVDIKGVPLVYVQGLATSDKVDRVADVLAQTQLEVRYPREVTNSLTSGFAQHVQL